jgi:hypothetical protein
MLRTKPAAHFAEPATVLFMQIICLSLWQFSVYSSQSQEEAGEWLFVLKKQQVKR